MTKDFLEPETRILAETDNFLAWLAEEPDGETTYHLEMNNITLHFFQEEWDEFLDFVGSLKGQFIFKKIRIPPLCYCVIVST